MTSAAYSNAVLDQLATRLGIELQIHIDPNQSVQAGLNVFTYNIRILMNAMIDKIEEK